MKVIGTMRVSGKTSNGIDYTGLKVHCTYPISPDKGSGEAVFNFFMNDKKLVGIDPPRIGDEIETVYNRFGKVDGFNVTKSAK